VLERLTLSRLQPHLLQSLNFARFRPACHSTESALARAIAAAGEKQVTALGGLDISAAFDTVRHGILLKDLKSSLLIEFLNGYNRICWTGVSSSRWDVFVIDHRCAPGIRSGSRIRFSLAVTPIGDIISSVGLRCHQDADDTQLYVDVTAASSLKCLAAMAVPRPFATGSSRMYSS
jgi:hypothetical protein